ncbi:MAG: hypothetical protein CMB61_00180 [Euryarchaeota archaeon]|nr:hypothetical protein [Euryarchaeota archaeon]
MITLVALKRLAKKRMNQMNPYRIMKTRLLFSSPINLHIFEKPKNYVTKIFKKPHEGSNDERETNPSKQPDVITAKTST